MNKELISYFEFVLKKGININKGDTIEIIISSYLPYYLNILKEVINKYTDDIIITYTDGDLLEKDLKEKGWEKFLDDRVNMYKSLVLKHFKRLTITSPFNMPITNTYDVEMYSKNIYRLSFTRIYFRTHPHTTFALPNNMWALKLGLSEEELLKKIIKLSYKENELKKYINYLNELNIDYLHYKTGLGTDLKIKLNDDYKFLGPNFIDNDYESNIPCQEIFISPYKYGVDGTLISSKPLFYKNIFVNAYMLIFKDGELVYNEGLDDLIKDESLKYVGEISLVKGLDPFCYMTTLLDENTGCHLALGEGFTEGVKDLTKINHSMYHIDLIFGTDDMIVDAYLKNGNIIRLIENNKFVGGKNGK